MYEPIDKNELSINLSQINQKPNLPVSLPSPLTPLTSHFNASSYSLFHTGNDYGWFSGNNSASVRNHSSIVEDCVYKRTAQSHTPVCSFCMDRNSMQQLFVFSCGQHQFCSPCLSYQKSNLLLQGLCPFCEQTNNIQSKQILLKPESSFGSDCAPYSPHYYPCVKLTNLLINTEFVFNLKIPWDISQQDVKQFFNNCKNPSASTYTQSIHIMMDRTTGKTLSDAYVEFATTMDMKRAIETKNQKPLKGRIVSVIECSQEELLSVVFPKWRGQFYGVSAIPPAAEVIKSMSITTGGGGSGGSGCPPFITREEINSLLVVCKNYKFVQESCVLLLQSARKQRSYKQPALECPQDIVSHLISPSPVVSLAPPGLQLNKNIEYNTSNDSSNNKNSSMDMPSILFTPNSPILKLPTGLKQSTSPYHNFAPQKAFSPNGTQVEESPYLWSKLQEDEKNEISFIPSANSPISSLIRDIHQYCHLDDAFSNNKRTTSDVQPQLTKNGIPLLFQPVNSSAIEHHYQQQKRPIASQTQRQEHYFQKQQLSPWTSPFTSKSVSSDIWRMPASPTVESNHLVTSESALIA
ncbi:hypothetical protein BD560DRAFT_488644 [Blakeslea trispora]|nr:hypothetical protein BD560DRAFT_488644 [Blakeslea trispora]